MLLVMRALAGIAYAEANQRRTVDRVRRPKDGEAAVPGNGSETPDGGSAAADMRERRHYLLAAAQHARDEARRARRLANSQTQTDVIEELQAYAGQLEGEAFLREQQAAEFAAKLATTRQLTAEIEDLADEARENLQEMADRLRKRE